MSKWLNNFLQKHSDSYLSGLSVVSFPLEHFLHKNFEDLPEVPTDKTDKPNSSLDLSVLSDTSREFLGRNQKIYLKHLLTTDKTDKPNSSLDLSDGSSTSHEKLEKTALAGEFEERIAIAEYDGQQSTLQAQRIAYHDAFIAALTTIPYETAYQSNWFSQHIKDSQAWLVSQGIRQPE